MLGDSTSAALVDFAGNLVSNIASAASVHKNRDWQEKMTRNAHTYEVQDLRNAGLNPILSAGGSGADVPSGNVFRAEDPKLGQSMRAGKMNEIAQKQYELQVQKNLQDIATAKSQAQLNTATAARENSQKDLNQLLGAESSARAEKTKSEKFNQDVQNLMDMKNAEMYSKHPTLRGWDWLRKFIPFVMPREGR